VSGGNNPTSFVDGWKGSELEMLRRISVLLLSALLTVGLTAPVALAAPPDNLDPKETGGPGTHADGSIVADDWGSVASELGDEGVMGGHSSNPRVSTADQTALPQDVNRETPRDGLGNVAKNDSEDHGVTGSCSETKNSDGGLVDQNNCDTGDNLSDHGCVAAAAPLPGIVDEDGNLVQPECEAEPGGNRASGS
jgi:hypothetical protein